MVTPGLFTETTPSESSHWMQMGCEWTVGADFGNPEPRGSIHNTHKAGYSTVEGVHVNCRRRNKTDREAARWLRLTFDDFAFEMHKTQLEIAIHCIEQHVASRFGIRPNKYWDAMRKQTVLDFIG